MDNTINCISTDLLVIGGAGAGLAAAVKAKQQGCGHVVVLEKTGAVGGCTRLAGGMFGINTPTQHRRGLYYDVDEAFRELISVLNWQVDALLVRKWLNGSGETIRWLEEMGMEFDEVAPFNGLKDYVRSTYHCNRKSKFRTGRLIVETLQKACAELGVEILTHTRARHLIKDDAGTVIGALAERKDGSELTIQAKAVVLATGSISNNRELIARFYNSDEYADIDIMADVPHNTGDGLIMAEEIGAGTGTISTLFIGPQNHYTGASEKTGALIRRPQPLRLNRNGERVSDESWCGESEFGWMIGVNIDKQPGKVVYGICDSACLEHMQKYDREAMWICEEYTNLLSLNYKDSKECKWLDDIPEEVKQQEQVGLAKVCQSLEEIAEYIGCDLETLQDTISRYNKYCAEGYDAEFLKDPKFMYPISTPPYYVIYGASGIDTCIGGLRIDNHQRVLDRESHVIPGLYAAGVLTSGWCAHNYAFFGSEMSYTLYSGRTAGVNALEFSRKNA